MASSEIDNKVYKFIVHFWAFRLGLLLGSVRIKEYVVIPAQINLFQNVFESIQVKENLFGKYILILYYPATLIIFLLLFLFFWSLTIS